MSVGDINCKEGNKYHLCHFFNQLTKRRSRTVELLGHLWLASLNVLRHRLEIYGSRSHHQIHSRPPEFYYRNYSRTQEFGFGTHRASENSPAFSPYTPNHQVWPAWLPLFCTVLKRERENEWMIEWRKLYLPTVFHQIYNYFSWKRWKYLHVLHIHSFPIIKIFLQDIIYTIH